MQAIREDARLARTSTRSDETLPQNDDAEEHVLGGMLLEANAIASVIDIVHAEDFFRHSHQTIFRTVMRMFQAGRPVDPVTVVDELEQNQELDRAGGHVKIRSLAELTPATANVAHHARIVREMALLRGLVSAGTEIRQMGFDRGAETDELVSRAETLLFKLAQGRANGALMPFKVALTETFERISELYENKTDVTGIATGFRDLDQITAGFQPANLVVLAARPSMGKSGFALGITANVVLRAERPCAFFSLEMSRQEVAQRLICAEGKVDSHKLRTGRLGGEDWGRLARSCGALERAPLYLDDTPGLSLTELRSRLQTLKRREPDLALAVVDYLQLMAVGSSVESRLQEVSSISRGLKALAKDLDMPILALSQLSRAVEQRHDKRPILSDLRESGTIEQDADVVIFIYRDDYYNAESESEGLAEIIVAKHRNGPTDSTKLSFLRRYAKFSDHA
jgi:replicative DNA helicase